MQKSGALWHFMKARKLKKRTYSIKIGDLMVSLKNFNTPCGDIKRGEIVKIKKIYISKDYYAFFVENWWFPKEYFIKYEGRKLKIKEIDKYKYYLRFGENNLYRVNKVNSEIEYFDFGQWYVSKNTLEKLIPMLEKISKYTAILNFPKAFIK